MPGYSLYPIAFNEMARIFLKVNVVRILAAAPFIVSFGAIAAFKLKYPAFDGALVGLKLLVMLLCLQPLLVLLPISSTTNDTSRMFRLWILVFLPVILIILACALGIFLSDTVLACFDRRSWPPSAAVESGVAAPGPQIDVGARLRAMW